jgi:Flp pilus assembly protein TadG
MTPLIDDRIIGDGVAQERDRGSVTIYFAVAVVGLFVLLGLVVDGGTKVRAVQRADTLAAEAARAGGQAINLPPAIAGQRPTADPRAAVAAARTYLAGNGVTGTVTVTPDRRRLDVTVTTHTPTVFLGLVGVSTLTAHGHASAQLAFGITGAQP